MSPPMRRVAAMCAVMCALLPAAVSRTVETEFVSIPKGGWHVFEVARDASHTLLHDVKFTNRASIFQGCTLVYNYARLDVALKGATVPVDSETFLIGGLGDTSSVFFGRNTIGDTVSANVTAVDCSVDLQAAFNFYRLLDTTVVVQKVQDFELSGLTTAFSVPLLPAARYVESVTLTMVSPCSEECDTFLLTLSHPSSRGSQLMNLTEAGQELTTPVEGLLQGSRAEATGWVGDYITSGNCTPEVEVNVRCRQLVVPGSPAPPTSTPYTATPFTPVPVSSASGRSYLVWMIVSFSIAAFAVGIAFVVFYHYKRRQGSAKEATLLRTWS
eukprot:TRINITY_DN4079_c0_g2_i1.p1 TRINITY_DN4079_c0_g2~~TRINITY_DN4079_c0_g2_i1.p1  ORF type:complete len:328 (+),score=86.04 TRINITY_DN4079_c0_g2_i1:68-1051(+)